MSNEILTAALAGLEAQKKTIDDHIASIRSVLVVTAAGAMAPKRRGRPPKQVQASTVAPTAQASAPRKRRRMSAEGRRRIAEAARRRWAAAKKAGKKSLG